MKGRFFVEKAFSVAFAAALIPCTLNAQYVDDSLVAHWPMDASTGTVLEDVSGNDNHGTLYDSLSIGLALIEGSGPVLTATGPTTSTTSRAIEFDGDSDVTVIEDSTDFEGIASEGSISMWINVDFNDRMRILSSWNPPTESYVGPALEKTGSSFQHAPFFYPNIEDGAYYMVDHDPVAGVWEHYVFTWDYSASDSGDSANPNRVRCYVNGSYVSNQTAGGSSGDSGFVNPPDMGELVFGGRFLTDQRWFDGELAEIAFYDSQLSPSDVSDLYNLGIESASSTPVAYYDFSETSGTSIADDSGNGNTMTLAETGAIPALTEGNGPEWVAADAGLKPDYLTNALEFDSSDAGDLVVVPNSSSLNFEKSQGTVTFWASFDSVNRMGVIGDQSGDGWYAEGGTSGTGEIFYYPNNAEGALFRSSTQRTLPDTNPPFDGQWMHVAMVWDLSQPDSGDAAAPNQVKMYFNGIEEANVGGNPDTAFTTAVTAMADWTIGRRADLTDDSNPRWFDGQLAEMAIFSVPLSQSDIQTIIDESVDGFVNPPLPPVLESIALLDQGNSLDNELTSLTGIDVDVVTTGTVPTTLFLSEDSDFSTSTSLVFDITVPFVISSGDGLKTVYAKVSNANGESNVTSDTITLDTVIPTEAVGQELQFSGGTGPTTTLPIVFTIGFDETVNNLGSGSFSTANSTAPGTLTVDVSSTKGALSDAFVISVDGATDSGLIVLEFDGSAEVRDLAGNLFDTSGISASVQYNDVSDVADWSVLDD